MSRMRELVEIAREMANERPGDKHPVAGLADRASNLGIYGAVFQSSLDSAVNLGLVELTPDCGRKQMGVFKFIGS